MWLVFCTSAAARRSIIHEIVYHSFVHPQNSGIEKAFLFDVVSKIYIATDSSPVDMQSYELCSDMIDVVIDISCIYGYAHAFADHAYAGVFIERASWSVDRMYPGACGPGLYQLTH